MAKVVLTLESKVVSDGDMEAFLEALRALIQYNYHDKVEAHIIIEEES